MTYISEGITYVVSIGNSDNKLPQDRWADFQHAVHHLVSDSAVQVHARCASLPTDPWQNAVWVFELNPEHSVTISIELAELARIYNQDSIAVTMGTTGFITPAPS